MAEGDSPVFLKSLFGLLGFAGSSSDHLIAFINEVGSRQLEDETINFLPSISFHDLGLISSSFRVFLLL